MITGYVTSDDDSDEDDFYSDPFVRRTRSPPLPQIQSEGNREEFYSALEHGNKVALLFKAIEQCDLDTLERLISVGVDINSSGPQEWTPLMKACSNGTDEVVEFLLEHGANPNVHKELLTPLMVCCTKTYVSENLKLNCLRQLIQHGADVNATDKYRTTALMYATGSDYQSIVDELLSVPNININVQDKEGSTALFYAVINNNVDLVKILIEAGTDTTLQDVAGRTAADVAVLKNFDDIAAVLGFTKKEEDLDETKGVKKDFLSLILDDVPAPDKGGFVSDVEPILKSRSHFTIKDGIGLPEFLNFTEEDLKDAGILFEEERLALLKFTIHQYHLMPWKKSSMPDITSKDIEIDDVLAITSNLMKHLTIGNASLKYLKTRITLRRLNNDRELPFDRELITTLAHSYRTAQNLKAILRKLAKHNNKLKICKPDDFISSHSAIEKSNRSIKGIVCVVSAALSAYLFCRWNICKTFHF